MYKARERIHRGMLIRDYSRFRLHAVDFPRPIPTETVVGDELPLAGLRPPATPIVERV